MGVGGCEWVWDDEMLENDWAASLVLLVFYIQQNVSRVVVPSPLKEVEKARAWFQLLTHALNRGFPKPRPLH